MRSDLLGRLNRLALSVLMLISLSGGPVLVQTVAWGEETADPAQTTGQPSRAEVLRSLGGLLQSLEQIQKQEPRIEFDPQAVVEQVGHDPKALGKWVHEQTRWLPYRGMLRGARGVLLDRKGNSLDRSLLLAELLRISGCQVRLAHATLPAEMARQLVAKLPAAPTTRPAKIGQTSESQIRLDALAKQTGVDSKLLQKSAVSAQLRVERATELVVQRTSEQGPALSKLLSDAGAIKAAAPPAPDPAGAMMDHWWVEYSESGSNTWSALDCISDDGRPPSGIAHETITPGSDQRFAVPQDESHEVELRVVVERLHDGRVETNTVLKQSLRPADVLGQRIALGHVPMDWPDTLDLGKEANPEAKLRELVSKPREWVPILTIGKQVITQSGIREDGSVDAKPNFNTMAKAGGGVAKAGSAVTDVFGGLDSPAAPAAPAPATGEFSGEWVEYEMHTPGKPNQTIRREIFDLVGPDRRAELTANPSSAAIVLSDSQKVDRGFALLGMTEIMLQPCAIPQSWLDDLAIGGLIENRKSMLDLAQNPPQDEAALKKAIGALTPPCGKIYSLAWSRFAWSPVSGGVYLDQVNILSEHRSLMQRSSLSSAATQGTTPFVLCDAFDIVSNAVAVSPEKNSDAFKTRLTQGIADTASESALMDDASATRLGNASDDFAASTGSGRQWTVLRSGDDSKLESLGVDAGIKSRMKQALADGRSLIAPAQGAADTWWSIDPETGQTLGMGPHGWGDSMAETAVLWTQIAGNAIGMVACIGVAIGGHDSAKAVGVTTLCVLAGITGIGSLVAGGVAGGVIGTVSLLFQILGTLKGA
jgi:hypothetical protein